MLLDCILVALLVRVEEKVVEEVEIVGLAAEASGARHGALWTMATRCVSYTKLPDTGAVAMAGNVPL